MSDRVGGIARALAEHLTGGIPWDDLTDEQQAEYLEMESLTLLIEAGDEREQKAMKAQREQAARHVLWSVGDPRGYQPGSFTEKLLDAWGHADIGNDARLVSAFPILGRAVWLAKTEGADAVAEWGGIR